MSNELIYHCDRCGSASVVFNATAVWNQATQSFKIQEVELWSMTVWCNDCEDIATYNTELIGQSCVLH